MTQDKNKSFYETADLSLSTTLSLWYPIQQIIRSNPRKAIFAFEKTEELLKLVDAYYRDEIKVSPQTFFNQLRSIKARLYANE
jgi:hypothetical protein